MNQQLQRCADILNREETARPRAVIEAGLFADGWEKDYYDIRNKLETALKVGNGGIIFEREPEDDNLAKALREIPYELIRTEPQWLNAVFAGGKTKNIERIAGMRGAQVVINMDEKAQECESCLTLCAPKEYGKIHIINRFQIVFGMEALADLCETEPSILVCDELSDDDRERAAELGVLFVVSNKSDDKRPYKEGDTTFIGLDMLRRGFCGFGVQFMAEDIEISELTK